MSEQPEIPQDENKLIAERRAKLAELRRRGGAFPNDFRREHFAADLHRSWGERPNEEIESRHVAVSVAGRIMLKRVMGKASFATVQDASARIQLYVTLDGVGAETLDAFKRWDLGDIVGATGTLFKTKTGELSVKCDAVRLLSKALRPLPEKWHGLTDVEIRYRQRYLDLIVNPDARRVFETRAKVVASLRRFFDDRGFIEVETPMMQALAGGAQARQVPSAIEQELRHERAQAPVQRYTDRVRACGLGLGLGRTLRQGRERLAQPLEGHRLADHVVAALDQRALHGGTRLVRGEGARLPEHGVDERGLAVVDVRDDRDVAQVGTDGRAVAGHGRPRARRRGDTPV